MDSGFQADKAWLLNVQRKLYQWSQTHPEDAYRDLWNWVTDPRNLRCAWRTIASNKGKRTPGIDGVTVGSIRRLEGEDPWLSRLREGLRDGSYRPSPCRRRLIPKPGKPGKFRPLGIPTVADRVVQCAVKQILEPIFEAQFWHVSYGFRPNKNAHGALEHLRMTMRPRAKGPDGMRRDPPYRWAIEGDIRGCFDNIDHHSVMVRLRKRVQDQRVTRLITQFLQAGVLDEGNFVRTPAGTPQGGVISPLLANIALSAIEERYERWVHQRTKTRTNRKSDEVRAASAARSTDRRRGVSVFFPVRYADDFVILVSGSHQDALEEKKQLAAYLREQLGLELSEEKTKVSSLQDDGFIFLGQRARLFWDPRYGLTPRIEIPKARLSDLRYRVKQITRGHTSRNLTEVLQELNPILRGWGCYYRFCTGAKEKFSQLDWYVTDPLWRWMRQKHPKSSVRWLLGHKGPRAGYRQLVWRTDRTEQFLAASLNVMRYQRGWMGTPDFAVTLGEPDA